MSNSLATERYQRKALPADHIQDQLSVRCSEHVHYSHVPYTASNVFKVRTLYEYTASSEDPEQISFAQGEVLDILDNTRGWWQARKFDGTTGIVPSNFLQPVIQIACRSASPWDFVCQAQVLYPYTASPADPTELSLSQGEIILVLRNIQDWWQARKEDGTIGMVPSNFLQPLGFEINSTLASNYGFRARALYAYTASSDDPPELSFAVGETLEILDNRQEWWHARKADGSIGFVPSNFFQPLNTAGLAPTVGTDPKVMSDHVHKARALYAYTASNPEDISFVEGEILDILDNKEDWWQARKEDGIIGSAPSNFLQLISS